MRDPNRIDPILARLRAAWIARHDLRLGQLLVGSLPLRPMSEYSIDDAWMADRMRHLFQAECAEFGDAGAPIAWPETTSGLSLCDLRAKLSKAKAIRALLAEAASELRDIASNESRASRMYAGGVANIGNCEELAERLTSAARALEAL